MNIPLKKLVILCLIAAFLPLTAACSQMTEALDIISNKSITSFEAVLNAAPELVSADEQNCGWSIFAPDGTARFIWSIDRSNSPLYDAMIEIDASPFIDAGLNPEKLPPEYVYQNGMLYIGVKLGYDALTYDAPQTPLASFERLIKLYPNSIHYHMSLDHFGFRLGNGNMFEWAQDMSANDKDIVFALNPDAFTEAGVDPSSVAGWDFAKVTSHVDGKPTEVDKLLKAFNLA